ncbi:nitroreductase family protein [Roseateles sp. DB2]|uniref:nitroreductase family protein n=1 Tax=Roseateles sp. DB2 TaxID=3453717 RepID=UPI003EEF285C
MQTNQTHQTHPLPPMEALVHYRELPADEMKARALAHYEQQKRRRTVRDFDSRAVPREVIEHCLLAAGTAPSGANQQPWHFTVISDPALKRQIREAAEEEERAFYSGRAPEEWLRALAPLGTDPNKPFLEEAPLLIAIFAQKYGIDEQGERFSHYYVPESVGIATGFLISALHDAGLATLTHTPSPMGFLNGLCRRPDNEKPVILLVVGYPKPGCQVPVHGGLKKPLAQISTWL